MIKRVALLLHRWLGLIAGSIVFVVALAGTMYAFEPQVAALMAPTVHPQTSRRQSVDNLVATARGVLRADSAGLFMTLRRTQDVPFEAEIFIPTKEEHLTMLGSTERFELAYLDPYTAKPLYVRNQKHNFQELTRGLHTSLLLHHEIGPRVVAWGVVTFVVLGLTGLVMWWPKSKKALKHRLKIKTDAPFKKLNYDLHTVLGFYVLAFMFTFAATGLMWSFDVYEEGVVKALNYIPGSGPTVDTATYPVRGLDAAVAHIQKTHPDWATIDISQEADPAEPVKLRASLQHGFWRRRFVYLYDTEKGTLSFDNTRTIKGLGDKINAARYNLHTGQALGLPGQVLVFCAGLISTSLPVTGLLIYLGNRRKPKKKGKKRVQSVTA